MRKVVIKRVIERGWPNDWYFINFYGIDEILEGLQIKNLLLKGFTIC